MPIAVKEWAVTVRALAEGEQLITFRKAPIREPGKPMRLAHERFFLYPTFDHETGDLVRESHRAGPRHVTNRRPARRGRPLPFLGLDPRLRRKAPGLAQAPAAARAAAAHPPHPTPGHGQGARRGHG